MLNIQQESASSPNIFPQRFAVAPMLDWTDRHCRFFHRQLSKHAILYSEMITTGAILHGDKIRHLQFSESENPVVLQLGGSDPQALKEAAIQAEAFGYTAINLNCGCPSDRVQRGRFGACLMQEVNLVAQCVQAMQLAVKIPVTVKCRIGVDHEDSDEFLDHFIFILQQAGVQHFIIHARKAWLSGLSPKENREVPPLHYDKVYAVKQRYPELMISINGGIKTFDEIDTHLRFVDGVMLGREAYQNPYLLANIDQKLYSSNIPIISRQATVIAMYDYIAEHLENGGKLHHITRHMLGLYHGQPNGKKWRRYLSQEVFKPAADLNTLKDALEIAEST